MDSFYNSWFCSHDMYGLCFTMEMMSDWSGMGYELLLEVFFARKYSLYLCIHAQAGIGRGCISVLHVTTLGRTCTTMT